MDPSIEKGSNFFTAVSKFRGSYLGSEVQKRILTGTFVLSQSSFADYFQQAVVIRAKIKRQLSSVLDSKDGVDAILSPTAPLQPFKVGSTHSSDLDMILIDLYTVAANLSGCPAISLPFNSTLKPNDLSIGLQLMGGHFTEAKMLKIALALENNLF